jgi:hypothetical protein
MAETVAAAPSARGDVACGAAVTAGLVVASWTLALAVLATPGFARAWSAPGHELVGAIAEARLSPAARALVDELTGGLPLSAREIAVWADTVKDPITGPWHYVNIPFASGRYTPARDCPTEDCIVSAIEEAETVLRDRRASLEARTLALRWLVHLVADLHQPLHAGDGRDRGGNDLLVRLRNRKKATNLHRVWDVDVVKSLLADRSPDRAGRELLARVPAADAARWAGTLDPAAWADESSREARAIYAELGRAPGDRGVRTLAPWHYDRAQRSRAEAALARAGIRLAALLDRIAAARGRAP